MLDYKVEIKDLLDAGVQYGHHAKFWQPKMKKYIYRKHAGVHVIDVRKTQESLGKAYEFVKNLSIRGGKILAVGTKFQCKRHIQEQSERGGFWYINERWLGGTLTNFKTIEERIRYLIEKDDQLAKNQIVFYTKREEVHLRNKIQKLHRVFGGVKTMDRMPDALLVVDVRREAIAVKEANLVGVPVIGLVDSNCDPTNVQYPLPSNDDSIRSIKLMLATIADAAIEGRAEFERLELARQAQEIEALEAKKTAAEENAKAQKADTDEKQDTNAKEGAKDGNGSGS